MTVQDTKTRQQTLGLSERSRQLLKRLIERYLREGQPVGSKTLASDVTFSR